MRQVWEWFVELNNSRGNDKPLPYAEIHAWSELTQNRITPNDLRIIKQLDFIALTQKKEA